jgi:hypothetical protein
MNDKKLQGLFHSACQDAPPEPEPGFDNRVLRGIGRSQSPEPLSLLEQLEALFPRVAAVAALVIALALATDYCASGFWHTDLSSSFLALSNDLLFTENGI